MTADLKSIGAGPSLVIQIAAPRAQSVPGRGRAP
jgi:hypothetical protein